MGSLKSPCATSYRSSIDTIALNCLVFEKITFFSFWRQTDKQTDEQMDSTDALSRSRCRERRFNNKIAMSTKLDGIVIYCYYSEMEFIVANVKWRRGLTLTDVQWSQVARDFDFDSQSNRVHFTENFLGDGVTSRVGCEQGQTGPRQGQTWPWTRANWPSSDLARLTV